ncbi:MAG: Dyp-type peroxidase [Candidatus Binatia bacterium]
MSTLPPTQESARFPQLDDSQYGDIQGVILHDYNLPQVRHYIFTIEHPEHARHLLGNLASADTMPLRITTGNDWGEDKRKDYALNVGLTYVGLQALHLPIEALESFAAAKAFVAGAVERAALIGDTGDSAPEHWKGQFAAAGAHVLFSLYTGDGDRNKRSQELRTLCEANGFTFLQQEDGADLHDPRQSRTHLPGKLIHFGYQDGISQPDIDGAPPPTFQTGKCNGKSVTVPPGAFLLGYPSQWTQFRYPVPRPPQLGRNGSFVAFRMMEQDVHAFEEHLQKTAQTSGLSVEKIAAKICGRWRDGRPLALSPDGKTSVNREDINAFDYRDDKNGLACPFGSHIRRTNPRGDRVAAEDGDKHPLIRRSMPYGPWYDGNDPKGTKIERGLLGLFICVNLEDQFEFLVSKWMNAGGFRRGLPSGTMDPLVSYTAGGKTFEVPAANEIYQLAGFSQFIKTRGTMYCFLPSITALRYIGEL